MAYWLMKSEPEVFSLSHLIKSKNQTAAWDGVRNYQVRNMMRDDMKIGDLAFFYHSSCKPPGIVGVVEIVSEAYPDFTAFDPGSKYYDSKSDPNKPRWLMVDVQFKEAFSHMITLEELRTVRNLSSMKILSKGNRLSITPVTEMEWKTILSLLKP